MKKLCIIGILGVMLTLVMVLPVNAAVTQNIKVPFDVTAFIPCANDGAGEDVHLTGELHILETLTEDGAGGVHVKWHEQAQGVSGVGLITGDKYRGAGVANEKKNVRPDGFPYQGTFVHNLRITGPGKGNNLLVHVVLHLTINANGETTAEVDNFSFECK